jgi:5'-methylthioinosine phosphorylase
MAEPIGLIVGSGYSSLTLESIERRAVDTPYGPPSSDIVSATIGGRQVVLLARHGERHTIAPDQVNYRANVWALNAAGVRRLVAVNAVGAIAPGFEPGNLAVPDQLIDYSWGRPGSFSGDGRVIHADLTEPFDAVLRGQLADALSACGHRPRAGTYAVTQGPRLETAAEIDRLERDGCAMVGMTAMPEAALARELEIRYAILALAINHAAGRSPAGAPIHGQIDRWLADGMQRVAAVLEYLGPRL